MSHISLEMLSVELSFMTLPQLSSPKDVCCTIRMSLYCYQILRNHKPLIFAIVVQRVFASLVLPNVVMACSASLVSSVTSWLANWDSTTAWNSYDSQDPGRAFTDIRRQSTLTFFRRQQAEVDGRRSSQLDCLNSALSDLVSRGLFTNDYAQKSLAKWWSFIHQRNKMPHDCRNLGPGHTNSFGQ